MTQQEPSGAAEQALGADGIAQEVGRILSGETEPVSAADLLRNLWAELRELNIRETARRDAELWDWLVGRIPHDVVPEPRADQTEHEEGE